jgi:hypothetical protein
MKIGIDVSAGGGFVGLNTVEVQSTPRTTCQAGAPPVCSIDAERVVITANYKYGWQPAVATGLVFRYVFTPSEFARTTSNDPIKDGLGVGLGAQFVFVPRGDVTRAAPALTLHAGRSSQQVFFGVVFAPSDKVEIPGGGTSAIVPVSFPTAGLIRPDARRRPQFFAGVVIGGVAVTRPGS